MFFYLIIYLFIYLCFVLISIDTGEGEIKVNFDDMKAVTSYGDVPLRRLSTKSAVLPTDHALSIQWVWYWLDETNSWREYGCEPMVGLHYNFLFSTKLYNCWIC